MRACQHFRYVGDLNPILYVTAMKKENFQESEEEDTKEFVVGISN